MKQLTFFDVDMNHVIVSDIARRIVSVAVDENEEIYAIVYDHSKEENGEFDNDNLILFIDFVTDKNEEYNCQLGFSNLEETKNAIRYIRTHNIAPKNFYGGPSSAVDAHNHAVEAYEKSDAFFAAIDAANE